MADYAGPWREVKDHLTGYPNWVMGEFAERKPRAWVGRERFVIHWLWGDAHDGTYFVTGWIEASSETIGNMAFLPTADEAFSYAKARSEGVLDAGAVQQLLQERNRSARASVQAIT